jgi:hypothetical protein
MSQERLFADFQDGMEQVERLIHALDSELKPLVERLGELTGARSEDLEKLLADARESVRGNRKVVLAVMGQVKTGKSTLLNALLFDGQPQLPTASTPQTARLTIIEPTGDGQTPGAEVYFYTREDWKEICERADEERGKESGQPIYSEVVSNAERRLGRSEIERLLGTRRAVGLAELSEYVSANGRYTDLVKYTLLRYADMPLAELKVVDTPGLNDPVRSREEESLRFLKEADAALFLSSPHRFLDREDMALVLRDMVRSGLREVIVVVPQTDTLDPKQKRELEEQSIPTMAARARGFAAQARFGPRAQELASEVFVRENTVMVSAMADIIGRRLEERARLNEDEEFFRGLMKRNGWPVEDPAGLRKASNLSELMEMIDKKVVQRKGQIVLSGPVHRLNARVNELAAENERRRAETEKDLERIRTDLDRLKQEREAELAEVKDFNERVEERMTRLRRRVQLDEVGAAVSPISHPHVAVAPWFSKAGEEGALAEEIQLEAEKVLQQNTQAIKQRYVKEVQEMEQSLRELVPSLGGQNALAREFNQMLSTLVESLESTLASTQVSVRLRFTYDFWDSLAGDAQRIAQRDVDRACRQAEGQVAEALREMQRDCQRLLLEHLERLSHHMQSTISEKRRRLDELERGITDKETHRELIEKAYQARLALFKDLKRVLGKMDPWFEELKRKMGAGAS